MHDDNIIDLTPKLLEQAAGQAKASLEEVARKLFDGAFRNLAEAHGLSDAWASKKAEIANEIIVHLTQPVDFKLTIKFPGDLSEVQHAAIVTSCENWAKDFYFQTTKRCIEAFGRRLMELALPPTG